MTSKKQQRLIILLYLTMFSFFISTSINSLDNNYLSIFSVYPADPSGPLVISDEADLIAIANSGTGIVSDPYIIENLTIDGDYIYECLLVEFLDVHCIIRNCTFVNGIVGVYLYGISNFTLFDNQFNQCKTGVVLTLSENINISTNLFSGTSDYAINSASSVSSIIENNMIYENKVDGINIGNSNDFVIHNNEIHNSLKAGIRIDGMGHNLQNNQFYNCGICLASQDKLELLSYTITFTNKINGKPIYYYKNLEYVSISNNAGQIFAINSNFTTISNVDVSDNYVGIAIYYSNHLQITEVKSNNNRFCGFYSLYSENLTITNSEFKNNAYYGILSADAHGSIITNNSLSGNEKSGLNFYYTNNTVISRNIFANNSENGLHLNECFNNSIEDNLITNNEENGIHISASLSNEISKNSFLSNYNGINLEESNNTSIQNNTITDCQNRYIEIDQFSNNSIILSNDFLKENNGTLSFLDNGNNNNWCDDLTQNGNYYSDYELLYSSEINISYYLIPYSIFGTSLSQDRYAQVQYISEIPPIIDFAIDYNNETNTCLLTWESDDTVILYYIYRTTNNETVSADESNLRGTVKGNSFNDTLELNINPEMVTYMVVTMNATGFTNSIQKKIEFPDFNPVDDDTDTDLDDDSNQSPFVKFLLNNLLLLIGITGVLLTSAVVLVVNRKSIKEKRRPFETTIKAKELGKFLQYEITIRNKKEMEYKNVVLTCDIAKTLIFKNHEPEVFEIETIGKEKKILHAIKINHIRSKQTISIQLILEPTEIDKNYISFKLEYQKEDLPPIEYDLGEISFIITANLSNFSYNTANIARLQNLISELGTFHEFSQLIPESVNLNLLERLKPYLLYTKDIQYISKQKLTKTIYWFYFFDRHTKLVLKVILKDTISNGLKLGQELKFKLRTNLDTIQYIKFRDNIRNFISALLALYEIQGTDSTNYRNLVIEKQLFHEKSCVFCGGILKEEKFRTFFRGEEIKCDYCLSKLKVTQRLTNSIKSSLDSL